MIVVEFKLDHPLLAQTLHEVPEARLTWERTDCAEGNELRSLLWADSDDFAALEAAMADDPTVDALLRTVEMGDRRLYQVAAADGVFDDVYSLLAKLGSPVQHFSGTHDGWEARIAFPDQAAVDRFFDHCRANDLGYRVHRVYEQRTEGTADQYGLTDQQLATLRAAVELGYLDIPRERTLSDLGEHLGVSDTAASQRFRRGAKRLIEQTVYPGREADAQSARPPR